MIDYKVLATSEKYREVVEFWRGRFANIDAGFRLGAPVQADFSAGREGIRVPLSPESAEVLDRLAADSLGRFTVTTAAMALLLVKYFNHKPVVIRTPRLLTDDSNRALNGGPEIPLVIEVDDDMTLAAFLRRVADVIEESYSSQDFPIQALLQDERDLELTGLTDFSLSSTLVHESPLRTPAPVHFDLDRLDQNCITIEFDRSAVEPFLGTAFAEVAATALEQFRNLSRKVGGFDALPARQREQLIVEWNSTGNPEIGARCAHQLFEDQAARTPDAPAVVFQDQSITYGDLNRSANLLANHLLEHGGSGAGQKVGIWMDRSPWMVVSVLGALKAGRAYVPIDADCPRPRLQYILKDSGVGALLIDAAKAFDVEGFEGELIAVDIQLPAFAGSAANPQAQVQPSDLAYVMYTSGSTGQPKGCEIEHRSLSNYLQWAEDYYWGEEASGTMGLFSPLSFDFTITSLFCPLLRGRSIVVYPQTASVDEVLRDQFRKDSPVDTAKLTPSHIRMLAGMGIGETNIRKVIVGGEELTADHVEILKRIDDRIRVFNEYGPTETTVGCVVKEVSRGERVTIGRPIANARVYILDDSLNLVPAGVRGEICISGSGVGRGYSNRSELTAAKFVNNPYRPHERLYRTGDIGRCRPDGEFECFGRLDDQVKIRGNRVELGEVRAVLLGFEGVTDAVVVVREVSGNKELVAYVVGLVSLDVDSLRRHLRGKLPDYMAPSSFVSLEALPLTTNGKVDTRRLPSPDSQSESSRNYAAPRSAIEETLARIWGEIFHSDRIGIRANFFELGGHSLRAMQMVMRIHQELGVEVSLREIFAHPTIEELAGILQSKESSVSIPIEVIPPAEHYAVSHGQRRLWILNQIEEEAATYNVSSVFELRGTLDVEALRRAFRSLAERHESLRTTFEIAGGELRQRIHDDVTFDIERVDLREVPESGERLHELVRKQALAPFDLNRGPLVRGSLLALETSRFVLALTMHHIVSDEWSMGVLIKEAIQLYEHYSKGLENGLPPLPIQYKDYSAWQRRLLASGAIEPHRQYWLNQLSGELPPLDLPADFPRPPVQTYRGGRHRLLIETNLTSGLKTLGASHGASFFMTLVAAVKVLLHRYTGQEEIRIGVPIAGRHHADLENQIGFYVNTLVLRDRIRSDDSFETVLRHVADTATEAYEHGLYPFDRLVEELNLERDMSRSPLFDVFVGQGDTEAFQLSAGDLTVSNFDSPTEVSKFDLAFQFEEENGRLLIEVAYNTDLFTPDRIARMLEHCEELMRSILSNPEEEVGRLHIGQIEIARREGEPPAIRAARSEPRETEFAEPKSPAQMALAGIWREALRLNRIGIADNFFELGGDSIVALQIVARANQAGLHFTLRQLFLHPTIAELAELVGSTHPAAFEPAGNPSGELPLTPIQQWFFEQNWPEPSHFNQSVLMQAAADLDAGLLAQALRHVYKHHDALRLRFNRTGRGWEQSLGDPDGDDAPSVIVEDLPDSAAVTRRCDELQRSLNISSGPLLLAALFRPRRLFIVAHHLVVDGVSWRILLEDLMRAYQQLRREAPLALPPKTLSFEDWAHRLQVWAHSTPVREDFDYWLRSGSCDVQTIPPDMSGGRAGNTIAEEDHIAIGLDEQATASLLKDVPRAYNTHINDALLTALVLAFKECTGRLALRVDLEGHGREDLSGDADVSRTVGWFTTLFPVTLELSPDPNPGESLKAIKENLRAIPSRGVTYGLLRYLCTDPAIRTKMQTLVPAQVRFNYLGQSGHTLDDEPWAPAHESQGESQNGSGARPYLVDVTAIVSGGRLEVDWAYSRKLHRRETIARLAEAFHQALQTLIDHCAAPGAGGFTASDFPAATITQRDLDRLLDSIGARGAAKRNVADIYDLGPMQQGMLFHSLLAQESSVYLEQSICSLEGDVNVDEFRRAWERVLQRHAVLRTAFFWREAEQPIQVVFAGAGLPWEVQDWRALPERERHDRFHRFLAEDRQKGLHLSEAPLMRCALVRFGDYDYRFCWTHHHILMDGWSASIVLQDVIHLYESAIANRDPQLAPTRPFRSYIDWLREQDAAQLESYWRTRLAGFAQPTPLPRGAAGESGRGPLAVIELSLAHDLSRDLALFGRSHHLTLSTLVRGAWALALSGRSGRRDIVYGVTLAGRPASLRGVERMVGLFINTLPVRFQIDQSTRLLSWLMNAQENHADLDQFAYSSLVDIQRFSDVPRGMPLFESILVFENYPVDQPLGSGTSGLSITGIEVFEQTNYPLTFAVAPGDPFLLRLSYDSSRYDEAAARALLEQVNALLNAFVQEPQQQLGSFLSLIEPDVSAQTAPPESGGMVPKRIRFLSGTAPSEGELRTLVNILLFRYGAHEDIHCRFQSTPLSCDAVSGKDSFQSLCARPAGEHVAPGQRPFDLIVEFVEEGDRIAIEMRCETERFDHESLRRVQTHLQELIRSAPASPRAPVTHLNILPAEERTLLLEDFNKTDKDWGHEKTIVELFEEQVRLHPDRIAVIDPSAAAWTYSELNARANQLARYLAHHHYVGPDAVVGVVAERSFEMVLALMAIVKAGGAYVPLDPEYPPARLQFMMADSGSAVFLIQEKFRELLADFSGTAISLDTDWSRIALEPAENLPSRVKGENLAYVIYTSGSTGKPKGAMNTHRGIANRLLWMQSAFSLNAEDRVLQKTPFSFDVSVWEFFWPLISGAQLVVAKPGGHRDSRYLVSLIEESGITTLHFVPSMLQVFLEEPDVERCSSLKRVICSGEAISAELLRRYDSRLPAPLHNLYGPTEAAVDVTSWKCDAAQVRSVVPIGKPIANTQIYILDEFLQPVPLGFAAELFIGGVGVGRGYLNRPELTEQKFIPDPFSGKAGARLYRTGDLARFRPDGNIEFLGRLDHQVKVRGFRIELGEIEASLLAHQSVRECVVIVREDQPDMKRIVAYVVLKDDSLTTLSGLRQYLQEKVPVYMVPSVIVPLTALPLLPNGKLDRESLPAPETLREKRGIVPGRKTDAPADRPSLSRYVPPRDEVERKLVRLWQDALGSEPIGVTDDYFELGGHSILAIRLMSRIQIEFGRNIPLAQLFSNPTVETLAAAIQSEADLQDWRPLVEIKSGGAEPPLFLLPGAGGNVIYFYKLAHGLKSNRPIYGLQAAGLDGKTPPLTSVEQIAAMNIEEVRRVQPYGPYYLAGHSFGGRVGFEMSQQLRRQGHKVGLLAILDTAAPTFDPIEVGSDWQDAHWLVKIAREIEEFLGVPLNLELDDLLPLTLDEQLDCFVERMQRAGWWAPGADRSPIRGYLQVYKANYQTRYIAGDRLEPVPIALFKTKGNPSADDETAPGLLELLNHPGWGWERLAAGPVRLFDVPGDHLSMLADPNVRSLALAIDAALLNAEETWKTATAD